MLNEENKTADICQSCGMLMLASEHFGTMNNGIPTKEYCCFCFNNGEFTDDLSVYEYATGNIQIPEERLPNNDYSPSSHELILQETVKLQNLKRWSNHSIHKDYYTAVYRVLEFINHNILNTIDLEQLADVANISKFHFHRIFKAVLNESPGEYIQRLKLEKTAFKLHTTKVSLKAIADELGYQSAEALSKAFKKKYKVSPNSYRKSPSELTSPIINPLGDMFVIPEIKIIPEKQLLCLPVKGVFTDKNAFLHSWDLLINFVTKKNLSGFVEGYYCISRDISTHTAPNKCRIYACVEITKPIKPEGKYNLQKIEGGKYAVFNYNGNINLEEFYCNIYRYWIPKSEYRLRDSLHFEKYLNDFSGIKKDNLLMEIYIPVE